MKVEGRAKVSQEELSRKDVETKELKASLATAQADVSATTEAYNTLKSRVKVVATELKERRVEVRTLSAQNEEFSSSNTMLETKLVNLQALIDQHEVNIVYKDKDFESLKEKLSSLQKEIQGKVRSLHDRDAVGEKAISSYKRKAQQALAGANARSAAANQAREEAEVDAKAAKTAADEAVERARVAETKRSEAEDKYSHVANLLDVERSTNSAELTRLRGTVEELNETVKTQRAEAAEANAAQEKLHEVLDQLGNNLTKEKEEHSDLKQHYIEQKNLCDSLQKEVHSLHDEVQRSSAAAFKRAQNNEAVTNTNNRGDWSNMHPPEGNFGSGNREESDGTIIMLQQELQGANEAITELKLALRTALLEYTSTEKVSSNAASGSQSQNDDVINDSGRGNDDTPLFFAIEKQNELNTAREEINRLANMLGDAESEKQEAYEAVEEMRRNMEDSTARLQRYEKLGLKTTRQQHPPPGVSSYGPFRNMGSSAIAETGLNSRAYAGSSGSLISRVNHDEGLMPSTGNDSVVNIEYLKNVMLSYLKAKTLADRRRLVPVLGTILCLTPEEQAQAVESVEQSSGLQGVTSSFWENIESKAYNLM